jgi:hypothetical protein
MFRQVPLTRLGAVSYGMILKITMSNNANAGVKIPVTKAARRNWNSVNGHKHEYDETAIKRM